jgi:hypothetical protein
MDIFGYDDRIIDNVLEQKERKLFYLLQENGLLDTERDEIFLYNGRTWRIHYWLLQKNTIFHYANKKEEKFNNSKIKKLPVFQPDSIYEYLPSDLWISRKSTDL